MQTGGGVTWFTTQYFLGHHWHIGFPAFKGLEFTIYLPNRSLYTNGKTEMQRYNYLLAA